MYSLHVNTKPLKFDTIPSFSFFFFFFMEVDHIVKTYSPSNVQAIVVLQVLRGNKAVDCGPSQTNCCVFLSEPH
jgi:hypothetical protein